MRGTLPDACVQRAYVGIIPAYAGNTFVVASAADSAGDHPRVCGEHANSTEADAKGLGSSPRMRGTPTIFNSRSDRTGIIPAYAGNTDWTVYDPVRHGDHPRVCGEHSHELEHVVALQGSSPRMRGTHSYWLQWPYCPGIIPAYAGNTGLSDRSG